MVAAALDVAARHPSLPLPIPLTLTFEHPDTAVRIGALKAHRQREGMPRVGLLDTLFADPDPRVRLVLRALAAECADRETLIRLAEDRHARVRAHARRDVAAGPNGRK